MSITFSITNQPAAIPGQSVSKTFDQGGTIGRTRTCDWVLVDASRFISGKHATINQQNGGYQITDTSTNGVYINDSKLPLGKGNSTQLNSGDTLKIGEYIIAITIQSDSAPVLLDQAPNASGNAYPPAMDNFADLARKSSAPVDPLALFSNTPPPAATPRSPNSVSADSYQLVADYIPEAAPSPPVSKTQANNASALESHFTPPNIIPDDWLSDKKANPAKQPTSQHIISSKDNLRFTTPSSLTSNANIPQANIPELKPAGKPAKKRAQQPVPARTTTSLNEPAALQALLSGMDVGGLNVPSDKVLSFMKVIGEVVKECVAGTFNVLRSRTNIKSEFRMSMTTIQAAENNPLKFSVNVDEAIRNMFSSSTGSYLPPVKAIKEGFEDIEGHQLAVMAGTQAAILALLKRFDPDYLEMHFDNAHGRGILPGNKKAKYWDSYEDYFREISSSVEDNFQNMFGEEFARAYETQIQRLMMSRRNR